MRNTLPDSESSIQIPSRNANESSKPFPKSRERLRNSCPHCGSTRITRRVRKGGWICSNRNCLKVFYTPSSKTIRVGGPFIGRAPAAAKTRGVQA